nr:hypothetical protein BaRGS_000200 [Batillaria attramentaria]
MIVNMSSSATKVPDGLFFELSPFLGSEKFWYVLVVAGVLAFQCVTTDIYIYKVAPQEEVAPTVRPINGSTQIFSWATFRTTTNKSMLHQTVTPDPGYIHLP